MRKYCFFALAAAFLLLTTGCQTVLPEQSPFRSLAAKVRKTISLSSADQPRNEPSFSGKTGTFTCGAEQLSFQIGMDRTTFRGTCLCLPEPPGAGDKAFSPLMFDQVAAPLLSGGKAKGPIRTVLLDPGHGGKDRGTLSVRQEREKDLNLILAREIRTQLEKQGFRVALTREDDRFIPLEERSPLCKKHKADLFLSIHHNAAGSSRVRGFETFACTPGAGVRPIPESTSLAWQIQRQIAPPGSGMDRGVRFQNFVVLRTSEVPAVLIEAGFLSNPADAAAASDVSARRKFASAVARGVREFAGPEPKKAVKSAPAKTASVKKNATEGASPKGGKK